MEAAKEYVIPDEDLAQVEEMGRKKAEILSEIKKVIVGQDKVIEEILIALFCKGHCLLGGRPRIWPRPCSSRPWQGSWSSISIGCSSPRI